jgi:hypothetical protein
MVGPGRIREIFYVTERRRDLSFGGSMGSMDIQAIAAAIRSCQYALVGIRASDATPKDGPCFPFDQSRDWMNGLQYALEGATGLWPHAKSFDLIGSDATIEAGLDKLPPGTQRFQQPAILCTFNLSDEPAPLTA